MKKCVFVHLKIDLPTSIWIERKKHGWIIIVSSKWVSETGIEWIEMDKWFNHYLGMNEMTEWTFQSNVRHSLYKESHGLTLETQRRLHTLKTKARCTNAFDQYKTSCNILVSRSNTHTHTHAHTKTIWPQTNFRYIFKTKKNMKQKHQWNKQQVQKNTHASEASIWFARMLIANIAAVSFSLCV